MRRAINQEAYLSYDHLTWKCLKRRRMRRRKRKRKKKMKMIYTVCHIDFSAVVTTSGSIYDLVSVPIGNGERVHFWGT